jgi:formate hydrogenlyase transcriptional activator
LPGLTRRPAPAVAPRGAAKLADIERDAILSALRSTSGVGSGPDGAAVRLGTKRTTLQSRMRKLGIRRSSY